ncbi:cohesin domain-containing protein [Echinimonas agarilytica]|uniref:Cohesin domain-containing protein n=1 Tax=Echinimonas agarilytica TaxID=1215918 RepID=A0AA41W813_9GAMM|nr:cohesin domain-containing protein [Echinimonas agarilytica]MCM2680177.1 cohesin domain-containing protein [Echinimonas agarilytica]
MFKKLRTYCAAICVLVFVGMPQSHALLLSATPSDTDINVGDVVSISVQIEGLNSPGAPSLGAFDINLGFDNSLLQFSDIRFGNGLDAGLFGSLSSHSPNLSVLNAFEVSFESFADLSALQPASFELFEADFEAIATGDAVFDVVPPTLLSLAGGGALSVTGATGANVSIIKATNPSSSSIPEPSVMLLMCLGLLACRKSIKS